MSDRMIRRPTRTATAFVKPNATPARLRVTDPKTAHLKSAVAMLEQARNIALRCLATKFLRDVDELNMKVLVERAHEELKAYYGITK